MKIILLLLILPVFNFSQEKGIVYILTNKAMKGYTKIGITSRNDVQERVDELYDTGVPYPFVIYFAKKIDNYKEAEKNILSHFSQNRKNSRREFLKINPNPIKDFINQNYKGEIIVDNRRQFFSFKELGIPEGSELKFDEDKITWVKVLDDRFVLHEGETLSLSKATAKVQGKESSAGIQALKYWQYQGKLLTELRREKELELEQESE